MDVIYDDSENSEKACMAAYWCESSVRSVDGSHQDG